MAVGNYAYALNNNGVVAGELDSLESDGYTVDRIGSVFTNNAWTKLATLGGSSQSAALAINVNGVIAGYSNNLAGNMGVETPVIWTSATAVPTNLASFVPAGMYPASAGLSLRKAVGINDTGSIIVDGWINNHQHAFLFTPK